jgi:hypothetical protein
MVKYATRTEVAAAAKNWSPEVLLCRSRHHSWEQVHAVYIRRLRYWQVEIKCGRNCGVTGWEEWDQNGHVFARGLRYPVGPDGEQLYLMEPGFGRVVGDGRDLVRLESVLRTGYEERTGKATTDDLPRSQAARMATDSASIKVVKANGT